MGSKKDLKETVEETIARITENGKYKKQDLGPFHLKDGTIEKVTNSAEKYMVIKEILFRKTPGQNNRVEVVLIMPDPKDIEVIDKNAN